MNEYEAFIHTILAPHPQLGGWEIKEEVERSSFRGNKFNLSSFSENYRRARDSRGESVNRWAWAIPNDKAIATIAALSPIVEIGAGTGYWASLLRQAGADVQAFDTRVIGRWDRGREFGPLQNAHFPVARGSVERAMRHYRDRTLLLVWPPYDEEWPADALRATEAEYVVYVGEGIGGCTGPASLHNLLGEGQDYWDDDLTPIPAWVDEEPLFEQVQTVDIPQWPNIHDYVQIYKRL